MTNDETVMIVLEILALLNYFLSLLIKVKKITTSCVLEDCEIAIP